MKDEFVFSLVGFLFPHHTKDEEKSNLNQMERIIMRQSLLKRVLILAVCMCITGILFAPLSPAKAAHAAAPQRAASCPYGYTSKFNSGGVSWGPGEQILAYTCQSGIPIKLIYQTDGNFVLYINGFAQWSTHTNGTSPSHAVFQSDGNLVVYARSGGRDIAVWASNTANIGFELDLQSDGNLVIYNYNFFGDWHPFWASNTCCYM